jgi:transposase-like protein
MEPRFGGTPVLLSGMTCLICSGKCVKNGRWPNGGQRWKCKSCRKWYSDELHPIPGFYLRPGQIVTLKRNFLYGISVQATVAEYQYNDRTILKFFRYCHSIGMKRSHCPCGRPAGHRACCREMRQIHDHLTKRKGKRTCQLA